MNPQDRSLGSVELHVSALAKESDDKRYPYESTGTKEATDPIRLETSNTYKGQLHYTATFVPALALKGVKFESHKTELTPSRESGEDSDAAKSGSSVSSSDEGEQAIPTDVTFKLPSKDAPNDDANNKTTENGQGSEASETAHTAETTETTTSKDGVEMSNDELLSQRTSHHIFEE